MARLVRMAVRGLSTLESPFGALKVPELSLPQHVWQNCQLWAQKPALTCTKTQRSFTFEETRETSRRVAWALVSELGLRKGDVVGIVMPNMPEFVMTLIGAIEAGLVVTFANPLYTEAEVARQFCDSGVKVCVTVASLLPVLEGVARRLPDYRATLLVRGGDGGSEEGGPGTLDWRRLLDDARETPLPEILPGDMAALPYSSGTTGLPKGVMLSHRNLVANLVAVSRYPLLDHIPTSNSYQEVALSVLPFYHIYGFNGILNMNLTLGFHNLSLPKFTPEDYIAALVKYRPTYLFVVPSLLLFLAVHPLVTKDHLSSIRRVLCGAAPATETLINKFHEKVDRDDIFVSQGYGMTESSPVTLLTPCTRPKSKLSSCGQLIPGTEAKVMGLKDGKPQPVNGQGELWVRGPQVMLGYFRNDAATRETVDKEGWLHTGDVVYYDEDEYFYVVDRTKELIKVKGHQVSPTELEGIVMELPQVADVAVVGVSDEISGELPVAFIVVKPGSKLTESEVTQHVEPRVAPYKRLAGGVKFVNSIPRNPSGKILRQDLRAIC